MEASPNSLPRHLPLSPKNLGLTNFSLPIFTSQLQLKSAIAQTDIVYF